MKKKLLFLVPLLLLLLQCKKDDETTPYVIREYSEQVTVDHQLLEDYLRTHTYNYNDFNNQSNVDIRIDTLINPILIANEDTNLSIPEDNSRFHL